MSSMPGRASRPLPSVSAALAAFLRGVERRAAVLAELQSGDAAVGDAAVESALQVFGGEADRLPMSEWPSHFWSGLLARPALRGHTGVTIPLDATDALAALGPGPRAAVLLRLAAGLDEDEAAKVLGIAPAGYRLALEQAVEQAAADAGGGLSAPQAWLRLRDQVQRRLHALASSRLQRLARAREAALRGEWAGPVSKSAETHEKAARSGRHWRGWRMVLWLLLGVCALAFAATFWWPFPDFGPFGRARQAPEAAGSVRVEPLPDSGSPPSPQDPVTTLLTHPDFEQLADPEQADLAADLAFYSWLAADGADTVDDDADVESDDAP